MAIKFPYPELPRPVLGVQRIKPDAELPTVGKGDATGLDVRAYDGGLIEPFSTAMFGTGLRFEIPEWVDFQVRSRSGLASKGLSVANSPATIDCDYRGELIVILQNHSGEAYLVAPGERIAQIVLGLRLKPLLSEASLISIDTARGEGGLGSSGTV